MIKERVWFFQINFFIVHFPHRIKVFVSFQPIWCHPHTQIRKTLFHGVRISIPKWKPFSQPYFKRIFSNCLFNNSPAKAWPYRFHSRRTTGCSILDHDFGHVCRGGRIQISGHSDFGIFNNFGASSMFTRVQADTASADCPPLHGSLDMLSMTFAAVICDADDPCSVNNTAQDSKSSFKNVASEYNSTFVFLVLCLQFGILQMPDVHQWGKMNFSALRPCFIDHLWFVSDFCQVPRQNLFKLPYFIHCCFCSGNLHGLRHENKFVYQIVHL